MKRLPLTLLALAAAGAVAHADVYELTTQRLDVLDQRGYFPPELKKAVHDLVHTRQSLAQARREERQFGRALPGLRAQNADQQAATDRLRKELELYTHPEVADFQALQSAMQNPNASVEERRELAQTYVWAYPDDVHLPEAEADLQQVQKQIADSQQAERDTTADKLAARAQLVERAEARQLSLPEWQSFLQDMSQEDLVNYLGHPQMQENDYWIYTGNWSTDPKTQKKTGLRINFNGTRVLSVSAESQ